MVQVSKPTKVHKNNSVPSMPVVGKYKGKPGLLIHHLTRYSYHRLLLRHIMVVQK
ncbi:unnamed protein product, partial [Dovyalis caffra]